MDTSHFLWWRRVCVSRIRFSPGPDHSFAYSQGNGRKFPRNHRAEEMLNKLANALATVDKDT